MIRQDVLLSSHYDIPLVILSVLIAILASYLALELVRHVTLTKGRGRNWWLAEGALAMGTGIWSMHFIGMLAFSLLVPIRYHVPTVIFSHIAAVAASGVALWVASRPTLGLSHFLVGGIVMGLGISTMHYSGMAAMRLQAFIQYDEAWLILSIVIAVGASLAGLWIAFSLREKSIREGFFKKLIGAVVMGGAIPSMHYTGIAAASFISTTIPASTSPLVVDISILGGAAITFGTLLILGFTLLIAFVDRRFAAQTAEIHHTNKLLRQEVGERLRTEVALRKAHSELEERVKERTAELSRANAQLTQEIEKRKQDQELIASLAKFPDENPNPVVRLSPNGAILYRNEASVPLLSAWECAKWPIPQRPRRAMRSVLPSPAFDHNLSFRQRIKDFSIQELIPEFAVEGFPIAILPRTPRLNK